MDEEEWTRKNGRGIRFSDYVQPACLPSAATSYTTGMECLESGWGLTKGYLLLSFSSVEVDVNDPFVLLRISTTYGSSSFLVVYTKGFYFYFLFSSFVLCFPKHN